MITKMEVSSRNLSAPVLPVGNSLPNDDPVQIRNIEGLGPVKANLASTPFATGRGEFYQGSSTGVRNIPDLHWIIIRQRITNWEYWR